jgi:hypothetical protein
VVEDADRTAASGEDAATVDGVHFKAVTGIGRVSDKRAAGRPGEFKGEGIGVCRCPFSDDVGDEASVVLSGGIEGAADGSAQVDSMHPHVAGKADVVEVNRVASNPLSSLTSGSARIGAGIRRRKRSASAATLLHQSESSPGVRWLRARRPASFIPSTE